MADPGGVRIGDAERQRVVDMLRRHTGEGRLTLDEFSERAGEVYAARTRDELMVVLADLPADPGPAPAATAATPATTVVGDGRGPARRRRFIGIMSGAQVRGPWRAPREIVAFAWWGAVDIDLSKASIESPVVTIKAWAIMGGVTIKVPEGIPVDVSGFVLMGGTQNRIHDVEPIAGAPLIRVQVRGMWGGVDIRNPRKRKLRDALRGLHEDRQDKHRDRHDRRGRRHGDLHGVVSDAFDLARASIDHALGAGSGTDRIPRMPGADEDEDRTERVEARRPTPTPTSAPAAPPPAAAAAPPVGANGSSPGNANLNLSQNLNLNGAAPRDGRDDEPTGPRIPAGTLTILVSDISGSTQMAERLGDQSWLEVLQAHNTIVRRHVDQHGGIEIKAVGDGFLVVFPSARGAVLAAIAIQRGIEDYRSDHPQVSIRLRVGLHTGEVVATEDDIFGQNVVVATRIADVAKPGEIVVSGLTRDLTASASDLGFESGTDVTLKGISQPWRVHRVLL